MEKIFVTIGAIWIFLGGGALLTRGVTEKRLFSGCDTTNLIVHGICFFFQVLCRFLKKSDKKSVGNVTDDSIWKNL